MAVHALEIGGPGEAGPLMPSDCEPELPIAKKLRQVLGPKARVIWKGAELDLYSRDQADIPDSLRKMLIRTTPDAVVQPETVEDVANVVSMAYDLGIPIVPRGAASFPLGGSVPTMGGIVLDLSALRRIVGVDKERFLADVEAGVRWSTLQEILRGEGLTLRTYPSSWFPTIAGWGSKGGYGINRLMEEPFLREAHSLLIHTENGVGAREAMELASTRKASIAPRHHGSYLWRERFFPLKPKRLGPGMLGAELMFDQAVAAEAFELWHRIATKAGLDPELEAHVVAGGRILGLCTGLRDPRHKWAFTLHAALAVRLALVGIKLGGIPYGTGI